MSIYCIIVGLFVWETMTGRLHREEKREYTATLLATSFLKSTRIVFGIVLVLFFMADLHAYELESRYANIIFSSPKELNRFNTELDMTLTGYRPGPGDRPTSEAVAAKIDYIVEKVMAALNMQPPGFRFSMVIQPDVRTVHNDFRKLYKKTTDYIAFYAPSQNRIFISAKDFNVRVVAHEIGHAVAENYLPVSPPQRVHEVLAQYAEKHVTD